jgi:uncharacterized membrane protein YphA (DoxX/SURF4 family)
MATTLPRRSAIVSWVAQLVAAGILAMASFFKLTSAPDSIALFERLGAEPWGRYAVGLFEAVTVILLLLPGTAALGGLLAVGLMAGAILTHLSVLGIAIDGDPSLFVMALITFAAGGIVAVLRRGDLPGIGRAQVRTP